MVVRTEAGVEGGRILCMTGSWGGKGVLLRELMRRERRFKVECEERFVRWVCTGIVGPNNAGGSTDYSDCRDLPRVEQDAGQHLVVEASGRIRNESVPGLADGLAGAVQGERNGKAALAWAGVRIGAVPASR